MTEEMAVPPDHDSRVQMLAKRLLEGERQRVPAAWMMRRDLLQRTWAWQVAERRLEGPRPFS